MKVLASGLFVIIACSGIFPTLVVAQTILSECKEAWDSSPARVSCQAGTVTQPGPANCKIQTMCVSRDKRSLDTHIIVPVSAAKILVNCDGVLKPGSCPGSREEDRSLQVRGRIEQAWQGTAMKKHGDAQHSQ